MIPMKLPQGLQRSHDFPGVWDSQIFPETYQSLARVIGGDVHCLLTSLFCPAVFFHFPAGFSFASFENALNEL